MKLYIISGIMPTTAGTKDFSLISVVPVSGNEKAIVLGAKVHNKSNDGWYQFPTDLIASDSIFSVDRAVRVKLSSSSLPTYGGQSFVAVIAYN